MFWKKVVVVIVDEKGVQILTAFGTTTYYLMYGENEIYRFIIWYIEIFGLHAGDIWKKSYGLNYTKLWSFWQKLVNHLWKSWDYYTNVDAIFADVSGTEPIIWC